MTIFNYYHLVFKNVTMFLIFNSNIGKKEDTCGTESGQGTL
jgi:hypothetical protein